MAIGTSNFPKLLQGGFKSVGSRTRSNAKRASTSGRKIANGQVSMSKKGKRVASRGR